MAATRTIFINTTSKNFQINHLPNGDIAIVKDVKLAGAQQTTTTMTVPLAGAGEEVKCTDPKLPYYSDVAKACVECTDNGHCIGGIQRCTGNKCINISAPQCPQ